MITDILVRDAVILELASDTKNEVLMEMAHALAEAERSLDAEHLLRVLTAREAMQSTGIGQGVAIPHGKLPFLSRVVASFARSAKGIDFDSIDGQQTNLFFLLVVPEDNAGEQLNVLSRVARFFRDAEFRKNISAAKELKDVYQAFEDEDSKL